MDKKRKQKNLLIGGLCAIVLVMAVGYAAFATSLNITGTAETTNTWDIEIISITPDKTATNSGTQAEPNYTTTGDITHSISQDKLTANFDAALVSPGDTVVYTIQVQNKGSLDATLSTITTTDSNNSAISFVVSGIQQGDTLAAGATKTFTATVTYVESENQGQPASTSSSFSLTLNYTQYTAPAAPTLRTVYAHHTDTKTIGTSTITDGVSDYTELSSYQNGKTWFLKYEIDGDNVIQNAYACQDFGISGLDPVCLQGGKDSYYGTSETGNLGILTGLSANNAFTCSLGDSNSRCRVGGLRVDAYSDGRVSARDSSSTAYCSVGSYGDSNCFG